MKTPVKISLYAASLAAAFGLSFGVGTLAGAPSEFNEAPSHQDMQESETHD